MWLNNKLIIMIKTRILNWCLKHLFNTITADDIIRFSEDNKQVMLRGEIADEATIKTLKGEAKTFDTSLLWIYLTEYMKNDSNQRMFKKATSMDDVTFAKAVLHTVEVQQEIIDKLNNLVC